MLGDHKIMKEEKQLEMHAKQWNVFPWMNKSLRQITRRKMSKEQLTRSIPIRGRGEKLSFRANRKRQISFRAKRYHYQGKIV